MHKMVRSLFCFVALGGLAAGAFAQDFPTRSVRIVVPQSPGGGTDIFARAIAQRLSTRWGQPVVVDNRAGAAGTLGTDLVAKAPADGYTLLVTYAGSQAINQSLYPKLPFDSIKDFQTIATVAVTPFFVVLKKDASARDLRDFLAQAKAKPGSVSFASSGNGSVPHLIGEMLMLETGVRFLHVPYKGIAQALTDVLGGQVDSAITSVPSAVQHVGNGSMRALAVTSPKRVSIAPSVPTVAESGIPGFDVNPWWGILGPAGMDMRVVRKINADVAEILKSAEAQAFFRTQGADVLITTPEEFARILASDVEKWAKVVKASGARID